MPFQSCTCLPGTNIIKLFSALSYTFKNKLKCFSLASLSSLVKYLRVRPEPSWLKHLSSALLYDRLLALPTNIRLGWKGLTGTKTLAHYEKSQRTAVKSFITLAPGFPNVWRQYCSHCQVHQTKERLNEKKLIVLDEVVGLAGWNLVKTWMGMKWFVKLWLCQALLARGFSRRVLLFG